MILNKLKQNTFIAISTLLLSANTMAAEGDISLSPAKEAFSSVKSLANEFITMSWELTAVIVVALVGIKLFKKFSNKAS
ncbi:major coat protein [Providencia rettgeri]|uniref:major coat protein n=1 Tax=Providencia rettgeri TaxID=587 RepID=UPI0023624751|nr:major coat protein [Providencia rettgeri]